MDKLGFLIAKARRGDRSAFTELTGEYEKLMYNIAYRYFSNKEDAQDMAQEAYIKAYHNIRRFKGTSFKSWLCAITVNTCIDELRKRKRENSISLDWAYEAGGVEEQYASEALTPEERYIEKEIRQAVLTAIHALPEDYKTLIILRDLQGLSYQELSEVTGLKIGTVKSKLSRGRNSLKKIMEQQGIKK